LTTDPKRLMRVARAQAALASSLELKLLEQERKLAALEADRRELIALLERNSTIALSVHGTALHRLVALEAEIMAAGKSKTSLQREVLMSRGREKSLSRRATTLDAELARLAEQVEIQEAVQKAPAKASHKHDVMD
jgi:hypothetical protein